MKSIQIITLPLISVAAIGFLLVGDGSQKSFRPDLPAQEAGKMETFRLVTPATKYQKIRSTPTRHGSFLSGGDQRTEVLVKTEPFYPRKRLDHDVERVLSTPLSGPESLLQASDPMVRKLSGLRPDQVLSIWSRSEMPMVRMAVEDYIKARWVHEKSQWEQALVEATRSSEDVSTLNALATLADRLLTETTQRVDLADHLVSAATTDRHLLLAARLSGSHASRELTQKLWERKTAEALEGLGHVIRPDDAGKLARLGSRPGVRRALIVAYRRTRDVRFMNELRELPR